MKRKRTREGFIQDLKTTNTYPVKWVGHWSNGTTKGCAIAFKDVPKIEIHVGDVYRIEFKCIERGHLPHRVSGLYKLWGTDYLDTHVKPRKRKKKPELDTDYLYSYKSFLKFEEVNPLEACERLHETESNSN